MTDIEHNRLSNKYSQMTDENLLVEKSILHLLKKQ